MRDGGQELGRGRSRGGGDQARGRLLQETSISIKFTLIVLAIQSSQQVTQQHRPCHKQVSTAVQGGSHMRHYGTRLLTNASWLAISRASVYPDKVMLVTWTLKKCMSCQAKDSCDVWALKAYQLEATPHCAITPGSAFPASSAGHLSVLHTQTLTTEAH